MISDDIKNALKNIYRNKKNSILIIIFSLLIFLFFVDMCVFKNFFDFYETMYNKNILVNTLFVDNLELGPDKAIEELKEIDHIVDVFESDYQIIGAQSNLSNNGLEAGITLKYGIKKMVPKSIIGKKADELLPGELVCPDKFYPEKYETIFDIDENKFLTKNQLLNREVIISYWNHIIGPGEEEKEPKDIHTKKMKIVGLYDSTNHKEDVSTCYISMDDMKEFRNTIFPTEKEENISMLHVIVDSKKNMNKVRQKIQDKGAYIVESVSIFEYEFIGTLFTTIIIIAIVIVLSILFIIKNYISKKIKNESKYIGVLRACGYTKKKIIIKELIENSIVLLISIIFSLTLFSTLFIILNKKIFRYFKYIGFDIRINIPFLLLTFVIILLTIEYINYKLINKKIDTKISNMLMEE